MLPFQIGFAESHFVKPLVKISKAGSHLLMDDCPINWNLSIYFCNNWLFLSKYIKCVMRVTNHILSFASGKMIF